LQRESDLLPRFAAHYQQLKALRRRVRRSLQRQWKRSLAGLALLIALGQGPALAATINVGGTCTLVRAIVAANNDTTASGNCTKGSGTDSIVLPSDSTQRLTTVNNTVYGPTGLPVIRTNMTIVGNNSTIRRAADAPNFRILVVGPGADCTLRESTVTGGIINTTGAGIRNNGVLILVESTVSGNRTSFTGGGVFNDGGLQVVHSTISGNRARFGAGVEHSNDPNAAAVIRNSTISGNQADSEGGGIHVAGGNNQVGIFNSTLSGNRAGDEGGGVFNQGSVITLIDTVISGNIAPSGAEIYNDVVEGGSVNGARFNVLGHRGLTNRQAFVNFTPGVTDITATSNGTDPTALVNSLNTTLANNGGPTRTHALVGGSPAIDTVTDGTCPPPIRDQRGVRRPQDGDNDGAAICDTGAFERR
jgi:hypothetical protein